MVVLALIALALAGAALGLLIWGIVLPSARVATRVEEISAYGFAVESDGALERQESASPFAGAARRIGAGVARRFAGYEEWLHDRLLGAGMYRISARMFLGYQAIGGFSVCLLVVLAGARQGPVAIGLGVIAAAAVVAAPVIVVRGKARARLSAVDRSVPDLIDMLVVTIEAGLGFAASMQAASTRLGGPLGDELRLTMQEQQLGTSPRDALQHLHDRIPVPAVHSFVRAVLQGEALGVSIGTVMRNLAREMRVRRRQTAEERAQKAPVKMLFPLVFLMFPALGIVILGPALIEVTGKLGS
jgi:tight adherence protein C